MKIGKIKVKMHSFDAKINYELFESAMELVDVCKRRTLNTQFESDTFGENKSLRKKKEKFYGVSSADEALDLLHKGWSDEVKSLQRVMKEQVRVGISNKRSFKNDVVGFAPIVPLAIQGVPNSMINCNIKPIKNKVVDICYDVTVSSSYTPYEILRNGLTLMGEVIKLEQQGYRVRLNAMQTYADKNANQNITSDILFLRVKNEHQPFDLKRVMFPMMHPAMFRVIGFGWYERCPTSTYRHNYGIPLSRRVTQSDMESLVRKIFTKDTIYISNTRMMEEYERHYAKDDMKEYINECIKGE